MSKGIKVAQEEIAWMEEFGTLDQPIASRGGMVFSLRSILWIVFGAVLMYKGFTMGGSKIAGLLPVKGLLFILPGILFLLFGIIPSKSVRREVQFLFLIRFIIRRLTSGSKNKKKVKHKTPNIKQEKRKQKEEKKQAKEKKKKAKPLRIAKK